MLDSLSPVSLLLQPPRAPIQASLIYWSSILLWCYPQRRRTLWDQHIHAHLSSPRQSPACLLMPHLKWHMSKQWYHLWFIMWHTVALILLQGISNTMSITNKVTLTVSCSWQEMLQHETRGLWGETSLCLSTPSLPPSVSTRCFPSSPLYSLWWCGAQLQACPKIDPEVGEGEFKQRWGCLYCMFKQYGEF